MKFSLRKIYIIAAAVILGVLLCAALSGCDTAEAKKKKLSQNPYRIMTATDLHYLSPELMDNGEFFTGLIENGDGKTVMYSEEILDSMIDTVLEKRPDLFIISGDLTFNGERQSHEELAERLAKLKESGVSTIVIPGNHDIDNSQAASFEGDHYETVPTVSSAEFNDIYHSLSTGASVARDTDSLSYIYESVKGVRILMLDVNANSAPGTVSKETLKWAEGQLKKASKEGVPVIAVSHQNLYAHNDSFEEGFVIGGADALRKLYKKYNVICNLSGHMHIQHIEEEQAVPEIVTGAVSVSPHYYGMITYTGDKLTYEAERLQVEGKEDFASWSESFFKKISRKQSLGDLNGGAGSESEKKAAADRFASLNYLYFSGRADLFSDIEGLEQLERAVPDDTFLKLYIKSILADPPRDSTRAVLIPPC